MKQEKVIKKSFEAVEREVTQYTITHDDFTLTTTEVEYALYVDDIVNKGFTIKTISEEIGASVFLMNLPEVENYSLEFTERLTDKYGADKFRIYPSYRNFPKKAGKYIGIQQDACDWDGYIKWIPVEEYISQVKQLISDIENNL